MIWWYKQYATVKWLDHMNEVCTLRNIKLLNISYCCSQLIISHKTPDPQRQAGPVHCFRKASRWFTLHAHFTCDRRQVPNLAPLYLYNFKPNKAACIDDRMNSFFEVVDLIHTMQNLDNTRCVLLKSNLKCYAWVNKLPVCLVNKIISRTDLGSNHWYCEGIRRFLRYISCDVSCPNCHDVTVECRNVHSRSASQNVINVFIYHIPWYLDLFEIQRGVSLHWPLK